MKIHVNYGFWVCCVIVCSLIIKKFIMLFSDLMMDESMAAAAKSLQSCPTLCDPIDGSRPSSPIPGILQARTLKWVAISFSNVWKLKVKVKSLSCFRLLATPWSAAYQSPTSMGFFQARVLEWNAIAFSVNLWRRVYIGILCNFLSSVLIGTCSKIISQMYGGGFQFPDVIYSLRDMEPSILVTTVSLQSSKPALIHH